jgi:Rad3-related DNA helicase
MFTQEELNIMAIALDDALNSGGPYREEYGVHGARLGELADKVVALQEADQSERVVCGSDEIGYYVEYHDSEGNFRTRELAANNYDDALREAALKREGHE